MFAYPNWSHDGQYVDAIDVRNATVIRIQIGTGRIEPIVDLNSERLAWTLGSWAGLAPDDSILAVRDMSTQEIYALELSAER